MSQLLRELLAAHRTLAIAGRAAALKACGLPIDGPTICGAALSISARTTTPRPLAASLQSSSRSLRMALLDLSPWLRDALDPHPAGPCHGAGARMARPRKGNRKPPFGCSEIPSNGCATAAAVPLWWTGGRPGMSWAIVPASPARANCWRSELRHGIESSRSVCRNFSCGRLAVQQPKAPPNFRVYESNGSAGAPWSSPVPLVGQIERVAYPLDALPAAIRGAVEEVHDAVQAPAEMVASSALAVASLAAQSLADVSRSRTLPGPCSLYFLTVAESGDRKSTVDRLMGRAVHAFQDEQRDAARLTLAAHTADVASWEAKRDATTDRMNGDAKKGNAIDGHRADLAQIEGEKPQSPRVPRLTYEDVTSEKLGKSLAMEWPSGGIFSSEGGAVLGGHSMGKDAIGRTLALLNKLWDGAPHIVDRATAPSFAVRGARMTISLQVQPHVLADFLDRDRGMSRGSGFLARFLVVATDVAAGDALLQGAGRYARAGPLFGAHH